MRGASVALCVVATALAASGGLFAQAVTGTTDWTMSVDELRPGMRGYGLTVFRGVHPERFDVEVLDVIHNFRPRMDLILIRPTHPTLEHAGTVGGMSGSPIFVNGRMIGAYAYGWEFGRDPVAGVTPIGAMMEEFRRPRRTPPGLMPGSGVPIEIAAPTTRADSWRALSDRAVARRGPVETSFGSLVPASAPMLVGGLGPMAMRHLQEALEPFGIVPVQAGGSGDTVARDAPTHYEDGGAVAVRMISGDISGNVTGTVTHVMGRQLVGFGHPMMSFGETSIPAAVARVMWILANDRRSFKIAEPVRPLGALVQDRGCTVVVDETAVAPTMPVHVQVNGADGTPHATWNTTVSAQRPLTARLAGSVLDTALEDAASDMADLAWTIRSRVRLRGRPPVEFVEHGASAEGVRGIGNLAAPELMSRVLDNAFGVAQVDGVDFDVDLHWSRDFSYVRSVVATQAEVDPGQTLELRVSLARYGAAPEVRTVRVPVPRELAGRELEIEVGGGADVQPDLAEPEGLDDLIRNLSTRYPDDALVVSVKMPGQGVTLRGRVIGNLPGSAFDALRPAASTESGEPFQNVRRIVVPVGRVILGRDRVRVRVREVRL